MKNNILIYIWQFLTSSSFAAISGICSIIGLIVAIIQIIRLTTKVQESANAVEKVLQVKKHEEIRRILQTITDIQKKMTPGIPRGISPDNLNKEIEGFIQKLNECAVSLPSSEKDISDELRKVIDILRTMDESSEALMDAEGYLYSIIEKLKEKNEHYEKLESDRISKGN